MDTKCIGIDWINRDYKKLDLLLLVKIENHSKFPVDLPVPKVAAVDM